MHKRISWFMALSLVVGLGAVVIAQEPTSDEEVIRAMGDKWAQAWNSGEVANIGELYTPDADWVGTDGRTAKGREAIVESYVDIASTTLKGSQLSIGWLNIRFVKPDLAVGESTWELTNLPEAEGQQPPAKGTATVVVVKQAEQWWIAAHRVRVPPQPPSTGE